MTFDDSRILMILAMLGSSGITDRSRISIRLAVESADEFSDSVVDSFHILCGLLREGEGVASNILRSQFGLTRSLLNDELAVRPKSAGTNATGIDRDVQMVMESSAEFARRLNHCHLGTEHLLAGTLSPDTKSADFLLGLGISLADVEHEILGLLGHLP